jgi:hypothetical protein
VQLPGPESPLLFGKIFARTAAAHVPAIVAQNLEDAGRVIWKPKYRLGIQPFERFARNHLRLPPFAIPIIQRKVRAP